MKAADVKTVKRTREFISDILPEKDCSYNFSFWTDDVLKGKGQEKISFGFNITVTQDNIPNILGEDQHLTKIKDMLSNKIGKKIRYLKVYWSFKDNIESGKTTGPCCITFEVKY